MNYLEEANEIYVYLKAMPWVGDFFSANVPIVIGVIGVYKLCNLLAKLTPIEGWITAINTEAKGDLQESDFAKLLPLKARLVFYKTLMPLQMLMIFGLTLYVFVFGSILLKSFLLEPSNAKFSVIVLSASSTILSVWLLDIMRLQLFQVARFVRKCGCSFA